MLDLQNGSDSPRSNTRDQRDCTHNGRWIHAIKQIVPNKKPTTKTAAAAAAATAAAATVIYETY